jgi:hypothetical protein
VKAENGVLHYHREYTLKELTLPPSDYAALLKLEAAITTDENNDAVLKKQYFAKIPVAPSQKLRFQSIPA